MKNYILIFTLFFFALGCEDNLDLDPLNAPSSGTFFTSVNDFELFVNSTYNWSVPEADEMTMDYGSDINLAYRGNDQFQDLVTGGLMPTSGLAGRYFNYESIRHAYVYFEEMAKFTDISAEDKARLDGTVYYMLAYRYFVMFRAYENIPIVTTVLALEESDIPSSDKALVLGEAIKNVDLAISNLPSVRSERGRLTKLAAMTLKTDMLLYAASRFDESIGVATYSAALNAANSAISEADTQGYGLAESFEGLFIAGRQSSADAQKEIIFERVLLSNQLTALPSSAHFRPASDGGFGEMQATQEYVDKFVCTDGLPINLSPLYDSQRPYANRDPRLGYSILFPGNVLTYDDGSLPDRIINSLDPNTTSATDPDYILSPNLNANVSGYLVHKYFDRESHGIFEGYASHIAYRYADLLLMAAEAENEYTGPSAIVYQRISQLRQRTGVGLPVVTALTHPSQTEVRNLIRDERAVELGFEGKRYWDIRRWGLAETVLNGVVKSLHISSYNADGSFNSFVNEIYVRNDINNPSSEALFAIPDGNLGGRIFITYSFTAPRHYVWPIPDGAILNSQNLEQHPLW